MNPLVIIFLCIGFSAGIVLTTLEPTKSIVKNANETEQQDYTVANDSSIFEEPDDSFILPVLGFDLYPFNR